MSGQPTRNGALFEAAKEQAHACFKALDELDRALGMVGLPPVDRSQDPLFEVARVLTQILHLIRNTRRLDH